MNQPGGKGHQQTYSVVLKGITVAGEESSEELKDVSVFQFSDGNTALCEVYFGDTGRSLIIPLAGSKGDKSSSNNPAFGKRAVLWTNERNGLPGGYAWAYWLPFEGAETAVIKKQRLQMEAFASVRCVKK